MIFKQRYLGGGFEQPDIELDCKKKKNNFLSYFELNENVGFVASGRSGLMVILDQMKILHNRILLPDYLCASAIVSACAKKNIKVDFYEIQPDLSIKIDVFLDRLKKKYDAVMLINYFGVTDCEQFAETIRNSSETVQIILNNVQAFYELKQRGKKGMWADWQLYSARKFFPVPDGGIVLSKKNFTSPSVEKLLGESGLCYLAASFIKKEYLNGMLAPVPSIEIEKTYINLFKKSSKMIPLGSVGISEYSKEVLRKVSFEVDE